MNKEMCRLTHRECTGCVSSLEFMAIISFQIHIASGLSDVEVLWKIQSQ